jgi:hypothetical protein
VDNDGYENVYPLHLKTITIAGLPVEEIPCVEVYDLSGKVIVFGVVVGGYLWNGEGGDTVCTQLALECCVSGDSFYRPLRLCSLHGCCVHSTVLAVCAEMKAHLMLFTHVHRCSGRTPASGTPACAPGTPSTATATSPSARTSSETSPWSAGTVFVNAHCYRIVVTDVRCWCVVSTYAVTSSADRRLKLLTCIVVNMGTCTIGSAVI